MSRSLPVLSGLFYLGLLTASGWSGEAKPLSPADQVEFDKQRKEFPASTVHERIMMPMRDGVKLVSEIYRPAESGKYPVLLIRTPYSRFDKRISNSCKHENGVASYAFPYVAICQNLRGVDISEGPGRDDFTAEVNDGYDTVEWIAKQEWSNGRVIINGASGSGIACAAAIFCKAPHLVAVFTTVTGDDYYRHFGYYNGVRRHLYTWIEKLNHGKKPAEWPKPATIPYDVKARATFLENAGKNNQVLAIYSTAWYDCLGEGAQDAFISLLPAGKIWGSIGNGGHGPVGGRPQQKARNGNAASPTLTGNDLDKVLKGDFKTPAESSVRYVLMGDDLDANAPGNTWMTTKVWPVAHTPTSYYLHGDGKLRLEKPTAKSATLTYAHDPKNPVPSIGGRYMYGDKISGPQDQSPMKDRKDVLRFETDALAEPIGITGTIKMDLAISSNVDDTLFVANLVDIYPDGYQALIASGPMMARYHQGLDKPAPLEKGKTYNLKFDLWGTAIVFNKGHKIGLHISSSSSPAYETHPNSYKPVMSYDGCPIANNSIHMSAINASSIILPVIPKESYAK